MKISRLNLTWSKPMPVNGQGVFAFNIERNDFFSVVVRQKDSKDMICLCIGKDDVQFKMEFRGEKETLSKSTEPGCGYEEGQKIAYWLSYDRDRMILKYGKGYRMEETTLLVYDFMKKATTEAEKSQIRKNYHGLFNAEEQRMVELYDTPEKSKKKTGMVLSPSLIDIEEPVEFDKNPFNCNLSPFVLDSSKATLFTLDSNTYMLSGSLPPACKELYENIRNCELDWPLEVEDVLLSDATRYSIETEGCILNKKLKEKSEEFGKPNEADTYLRVTLGHSFGNSPGIPYVLEIWPSGHYSPIHDHGNANAVIKVLFGSIHISCFNKHTKTIDAKPLKTFDARKGDVTWINRNWFQTHQLKNITDDFCATIQCYSYDAGDKTHWPYFDYVKDNSIIDEFLPNSDFKFTEMRRDVVNEYRSRMFPKQ